MRKYLIATLLCIGFWSCGNGRHANGFGSETTNGIALSGLTEPGCIVIAHPAASVSVVDSLLSVDTADAQGHWNLQIVAGGWLLEFRHDSVGYAQNIKILSKDSALDFGITNLSPLVTISGQVANPVLAKSLRVAATSQRVTLLGLGRSASVDAQGGFSFADMAPGTYIVQVESDSLVLSQSLLDAKENASPLLPTSFTGLLLENFDDGDSKTLLAPLLGSSFWLAWSGVENGNVVAPAILNETDLSPLLTDSGAYSGKSLHWTVNISDTNTTATASVLLVLGNRGIASEAEVVHNLASSDSMTFMAKGSGTVVVTLWADQKSDGARVYLEQNVILDSVWTRYDLQWRSFHVAGDTASIGDTWANYDLLKITWVFKQDGELWLDDILIPDLTPINLLQ